MQDATKRLRLAAVRAASENPPASQPPIEISVRSRGMLRLSSASAAKCAPASASTDAAPVFDPREGVEQMREPVRRDLRDRITGDRAARVVGADDFRHGSVGCAGDGEDNARNLDDKGYQDSSKHVPFLGKASIDTEAKVLRDCQQKRRAR